MTIARRALFALLYAGLCLLEFVVGWAKERVEQELIGEKPKKPDDEE